MGPAYEQQRPPSIQVDLANFLVTANDQQAPARPPPPKLGFIRRAKADGDASNKTAAPIYTISPARHSLSNLQLTNKKGWQ
jgi:hypothetical protein